MIENEDDPIVKAFNDTFDELYNSSFSEFEDEMREENQADITSQMIAAGEVEEGVADMFDMEDMQDSDDAELA